AAVKDFNMFTATLHPKAETGTIDVLFADLRQIGYGRKGEGTAKDITRIALEDRCVPVAKVEGGAGELEGAAVRFYGWLCGGDAAGPGKSPGGSVPAPATAARVRDRIQRFLRSRPCASHRSGRSWCRSRSRRRLRRARSPACR